VKTGASKERGWLSPTVLISVPAFADDLGNFAIGAARPEPKQQPADRNVEAGKAAVGEEKRNVEIAESENVEHGFLHLFGSVNTDALIVTLVKNPLPVNIDFT
jgi:hypothetical protein